jgi:hypothetical protein
MKLERKKRQTYTKWILFFFSLHVHDKNVSDCNISKKEKTAFTHTHYIYIDRQPQKKTKRIDDTTMIMTLI